MKGEGEKEYFKRKALKLVSARTLQKPASIGRRANLPSEKIDRGGAGRCKRWVRCKCCACWAFPPSGERNTYTHTHTHTHMRAQHNVHNKYTSSLPPACHRLVSTLFHVQLRLIQTESFVSSCRMVHFQVGTPRTYQTDVHHATHTLCAIIPHRSQLETFMQNAGMTLRAEHTQLLRN